MAGFHYVIGFTTFAILLEEFQIIYKANEYRRNWDKAIWKVKRISKKKKVLKVPVMHTPLSLDGCQRKCCYSKMVGNCLYVFILQDFDCTEPQSFACREMYCGWKILSL